jgi:fermentation-respiration switch protein FrsA (DUF1100 family)
VIRALDLAEVYPNIAGNDIHLYGAGRQGMYTLMASVLDSRISVLELSNGLESITELVMKRYFDHYDVMGLFIPGILAYLDLPDLLHWRKQMSSNRIQRPNDGSNNCAK